MFEVAVAAILFTTFSAAMLAVLVITALPPTDKE